MIGTTGRFNWNGFQFSPSSIGNVEAELRARDQQALWFGSSRTTRVKCRSGMPLTIFFHVLP